MNLEKTRKALRMTQAEIAELVRISRNAWRALETGEAKPHSETLERFRDLLQAVVAGALLVKYKAKRENSKPENRLDYDIKFSQINTKVQIPLCYDI